MKFFVMISLLLLTFTTNANSTKLEVPSDPKATYTVIQNKNIGKFSVLQTIRKGSSGVSFSTRLFNCQNATFKYLVTVDGEENMDDFLEKNNAAMENLDDSDMSPVTQGSITFYAFKYSCK